jgi:hypothetical protein
MPPYGPLAAHSLMLTEQYMQPSKAREQLSNELNLDGCKASLKNIASHID